MTYRSTLLARGDIKWYFELDETSGTTAVDDAGAGADGTYTGGFTLNQTPGPLADEAGGWVLLNGSTGYVVAADHADRDLGDTLSLIVWFQRTAAGGSTEQIIVSKGANAYAITMNMAGVSNKLGVAKVGVGAIVNSTVDINDTNVHMFAWTKSGATNKLYLDGVDVTGTVTNQTLADGTEALQLGRLGNNTLFFNGKLGRMSGHNAAISAADIAALYVLATVTAKVGSDTGTGAEEAVVLSAAGAATDTGSGADAATTQTATLDAADTGAGTDSVVAYGESGTYAVEVLADSPTFVLPMDEPSGNLASLVGGHSATKVGSPTYGVAGPIVGHTAVQFANAADYFTVPDHLDLDLGDGPFSLEFWIARDTDTSGTQTAFHKGATGYGAGISNSDKLILYKSGVAILFQSSGNVSADSAWHHYVITRSAAGAGNTKIYVDAVDVTVAVSAATALADTTAALEIGREGAAQSLAGRLAYVALYKSVLSGARVTAHFAAAVPAKVASDTGSGVEETTTVNPELAATDTGAGVDAATATSVALTAAEAGTGADDPTFFDRPAVTDTATGNDATLAVSQDDTVAVLATDTGAGAEEAGSIEAAPLSVGETGSGSDILAVLDHAAADTAASADTASLGVVLSAAEAGAAVEAQAGLGIGGAGSLEQEILDDSPVVLFWFDEPSGNLVDEIAGHIATPGGAPTYGEASPVPFRTAVRFPADTDFFTVPDHADLDLGNGPYTLEVIVRRDTDTGIFATMVWKGTGAYAIGWDTSDKWELGAYGVAQLIRESAFTPSGPGWVHYVITFSGASTGKVYKDAADVTTAMGASTTVDTSTVLEIGRSILGGVTKRSGGSIALLAIYKSILSADRVTAHHGSIGNGGDRTVLAGDSRAFVEEYTETASVGPDESGVGVDVVITLTAEAVETVLTLFASDEGAGVESSLVTAFSQAIIGRPVEYVIELFDSTGTFGPGTRIGEVWDARNLGWSAYDRLPGKAFFTLFQRSPHLALMEPLTTHVKVWRLSSNATVNVYSGEFIDYDAGGDDVILNCFDYLALLSISRTGYKVLYPKKTLKHIVDAELALAKAAVSSPLAFLTSGTTETPLGTDGATEIETNNQFGLLDQMRLQLFFDLSEMGRANTANHVTYGISRTAPHTFTFKKNAGSALGLGLVLNGNVSDYRHLPNWSAYRNDLATIGTTVGGGATEVVVTDDTAATQKGRRQDVFTIKTILGIVGRATEADSQRAAAERMLRSAVEQSPVLMLRLLRGAVEPFVGWEINDRAPVEISNGIDSIAESWRIVGVRGVVTEAGEDLSLIVEPVLAT